MTPQPSIAHHLSEALLADYAAGRLPDAIGTVVAAHLSLCDECRAALAAQEAFAGALVDTAAPVAMAAGAMQAAMTRALAAPPRRIAPAPGGPLLPAPLRDAVGGDLAAVRWRSIGVGVRQAILPSTGPGSVRLLSIQPGLSVPQHSHRGREVSMVICGSYRDGDDRYGPGDVEIADDAVDHMPVADPGAVCICVIATDSPLRFRGWLPRLVQPFIGI